MHNLNTLHCLPIPTRPEGETRPLWSVMIPTYNCAEYLKQTLTSVLAQDPGPDVMQIQVVDDYSTKDDPKSVVEEIGQGRVEFYQQPQNVGFIRNFETCLQNSRGYLIHQLHGDDSVRQGFYQKMQHLFEREQKIGAAFCRAIYTDESGHWQSLSRAERSTSGILDNWLETIVAGQCIATPSIVVRREVYETLGGFDRRIVCSGEDWEMWVRLAAHYAVAYEPEPLALYRFKPIEDLPPQKTQQIIKDMLVASEIIRTYLSEQFPEGRMNNLLRQSEETYALWGSIPAKQAFATGDFQGGWAILMEMLRCSHSRRVIQGTMRSFIVGGIRNFKRMVQTDF
jgi:cellulose synthase/poly-beta-1,6-N-acetylglucosamine synthase-like glycosyltransferase